jgi:tRNA G18 (ribose-2'-O)-methylase SpoU
MHDDSDTQGNKAGDGELPSRKGGDEGGGADDFDLIGFKESEGGEGEAAKPAPKPRSPAGYGADKGPRKPPAARGEGPRGRSDAPRGYGPRAGNFSSDRREGKPWERRGEGPRERGPGGPRRDGEGAGRRYPAREGDAPRGRFNREGAGPRSYGDRGGAGAGPRRFDRGPRGEAPRSRGDAPRSRAEGPSGPPPRRYAPPPGAAPRVVQAAGSKPVSPEVKPYLYLKQEKGRFKESRFILEGVKNIADVLTISPAIFHEVFIAEDFKEKDLLALLKKHRIPTVTVTSDDIAALSDTETPQGIIAIANFATLKIDYNVARYITLLDAVQDPGNVGAILRTSLALGMDAVVMGKGTCDPYNSKVVRSSVGALLRMPFETDEGLESKIGFLRQKGYSIVASSSHAKITLDQAKLRKKVALIVGNEGAGSGASYLDMADAVVRIPMKNQVESLNVAVAHGILSHQLIHGRD